ncbi:nitroreductase [Sagittula marina]|uniref:Nitroreductase n=1 Tax=Sagittula marina TaxID=943940 RepID=A0A7W6DPV1_9RHOB|nr:nitroreductase family protein [Sagittula marina]MBB3984732.1 nitroreductase [Sagittula marina]
MFAKSDLRYTAQPLPLRPALTDAQVLTAARTFEDAMSTRCTTRDFDTRPVERAVIESAIRTAGGAPSGANHQPWHFVAIGNPALKAQVRAAAEEEEARFYEGAAGDEWLSALEPIGTGPSKPHLEDAPWLIVIFAQRYGEFDDGTRYKNYYVNESVGIATGFLIAALHQAGLSSLTHTPNPMKFLNDLCQRPASEKPVMILAVGHAAADATTPAAARIKKPLDQIMTTLD